jgi:hypothetical protein
MSDLILKINRFSTRCRHNKYIVDPRLNVVECGICGDQLNPMWVLEQLCNQEQRAYQRLQSLNEQADKAEAKNRCKCEKCGEMTRIQK